jgi:hypothetical protein
MRIFIFLVPPLLIVDGGARANYYVAGIWDDGTAKELTVQLPFAATQNQAQERALVIDAVKQTAAMLYPDLVVPINPTIRWMGI